MKTKILGNSDMNITIIGLGAWAIGGGGWAYGWGPQDDESSIRTIHHALDLGINWVDTAPVYGLGHGEEVVGRALKGRADKPFIFTKCAMKWDDNRKISFCLTADSVREEVESSLRRLQVDAIDLYQIHWPNPDPEIEEGWATMAKLQQEGKLRYIGVSNFNVSQMERAAAIAPVTSLQPPYSILERGIEREILPYCTHQNTGVIVYSPMKSGLLTGKMTAERIAALPEDDWRKRGKDYNEPRLSRNLKLVDLLRAIGRGHQCSPGEIAIAWTLRNPAVTAAIVGARSPEQVDGFIGAADIVLSDDEMNRIETFLRDNPVPAA